jgi:hypothetical protein
MRCRAGRSPTQAGARHTFGPNWPPGKGRMSRTGARHIRAMVNAASALAQRPPRWSLAAAPRVTSLLKIAHLRASFAKQD